MKANIGLKEQAREEIARDLSLVLANAFVLYTKTLNFHWNLIDPRFDSLHKMFEGQYEELAEAIDGIAERVRMLGIRSPGSLKEFQNLATLNESESTLTGDEMIRTLLEDHEAIICHLREKIPSFTKLGDEGTADLYIERLRSHEKTAWMLRSHLTS